MKSYQSFEPSSPDEEEQQHHRRLSTNDLGSMENLSELTSLTELNTRLSPPSENPYFEDCVKHVRHLASSSVRFLFCLSVVATMFLVIQSETTLLDFAAGEDESSHWIGAAANDAWELGFSGWKAHRLAQSSMVHVVDDSSSATAAAAAAAALERLGSSQHGNSKQQQSTTDTTTTTTTIAPPPPQGCETTVMLIRHCEKGNLKSHCNYLGFERAAYLASLFGDDPKDRWPLPSKLYAMRAKGRTHGKKSNYREIETVQFIASKAAANNHHYLEINEGYDSSNEKNLASEILESIVGGQQCGKLTLVSWKHSELPKLAQHLGKKERMHE